jgi:hypothetical protein
MDKRLAIRMLDLIEKLNIENLALRALLLTLYRNKNKSVMESLLNEALNNKEGRDAVHATWLPVRKSIESDANLEQAIQQFLQIVPPAKGAN